MQEKFLSDSGEQRRVELDSENPNQKLTWRDAPTGVADLISKVYGEDVKGMVADVFKDYLKND